MKFVLAALLISVLSACVSVVKVESGERAVGERMSVTIDGPWNHLNAPGLGPAQTWTMEGLAVDQLLLYSGIKDGQVIHAERAAGSGPTPKSFSFRSAMQPDEIVAMFEGMLTRDGSRFTLKNLEPMAFAGGKGFRFDYELIRKVDNVQLQGRGYGSVNKGELFAIIYTAPRLAFFARHQGRVEQIALGAKLKE
jgi:hypothetical protein